MKVIKQAIDKATRAGVFTLEEVNMILGSINAVENELNKDQPVAKEKK